MKVFEYTITDPEGIHALPAGGLVKLAKSFSSNITARGNGQSTDAKLVFGVMSLGIKYGQTLTVICDGIDEEMAASALMRFVKDNL